MGVGAVTVNGNTLTSKADRPAFEIEFQANRLNGITKFRFKDDSPVTGGAAIDIREQYELIVTDDGTRVFGGRIATLEPQLVGKTIWWTGNAVSFDVLLDERVIENGLRDGATRYDDDDVNWIVGHHSELVGTTYVSRLRTAYLPTIDYSGKSLRQALNILAGYTTGPVVWVDMNKAIHWTNPASAQKVANPGFDGGSGGNWSLDAAAVVTADAGPGSTGDYALVTTGNGAGRHETTQTVTGIVAGKRYLFAVWMQSSVAAAAAVRLDWQNSSSVSQRIDTIASTGTAWRAYKDILIAPATATKVIVMLGGANNFTGTARHDNLGLVQETAAWGISTNPDGSTTYSPYGWREPRRSVQPINRVLVRGLGISGWREHAASIAYYGGRKFEGAIEDERVTTTDGIDSRAASLFRKYAFPSRSGTYQQTAAGLVAGTWQTIDIPVLGLKSIEWIATLRIAWLGNGKMLYTVIYGEPEEDLASGLVASSAGFNADVLTPGVEDPGINPPGVDSTPPGTPTNMQLSSGSETAIDGTLVPALVASWTGVGDADLDAYEGQYDPAIQTEVDFSLSASGSGGNLAAGTYNVAITGVGTVGGETKATSDKSLTITAGQRLYVNITALTGCSSYKVYASRSGVNPPQSNNQTTAVTGSNVEITPEGSGATPPLSSTAVAFINPTAFRTATTSISISPVRGGIYYAARVRSIDRSGNRSAFTGIAGVVAAPDSVAPAIPNGLSAVGGFRLVGVRWAPVIAADLAKYELRWAPSIGASPNTIDWEKVSLASTAAIIDDLVPDTAYFVQVRAIDSSGNVRTSETVATAVNADTNPEAGWSNTYTVVAGGLSTTLAASANAGATNLKVASVTGVTANDLIRVVGDDATTSDEVVRVTNVGTAGAGGTGLTISPALGHAKANGAAVTEVTTDYVSAEPSAIGAADFAANSIIARIIAADSISATDIHAGTLSLGGLADMPDYLLVFSAAGVEIGRWDQNGLVVVGSPTTRAMRFMGGVLSFTSNYMVNDPTNPAIVWSTAISADGIDAAKITFGSAPGGSNSIPNASFEMSAFSATLQMKWDTTAEWDAYASGVNADGVANVLQLVTYTY